MLLGKCPGPRAPPLPPRDYGLRTEGSQTRQNTPVGTRRELVLLAPYRPFRMG